MKAEEIMIGDLLCVTKDVCIKKGTIVRIRAIDADDSLLKMGLKGAIRCQPIDDDYGMNIGGVWADFLEPIPLTAEILEKNGFSDNYTDDDLSYAADAVGDIIGVHILGQGGLMDEMYFDYVHQLQHALRLCGIDKEIVL